MNILSPSILGADFYRLGEQISEVEASGVRYLHIDVMDGIFVPSISFGMPVIRSIRNSTDLFFDVHLMIRDPERYIAEFAECGADLLNFHLEAARDPDRVIDAVRSQGKKAGITIKPSTPVEAVLPYLRKVDMVLVMTVEPGFGGQKMIPECLDKVRAVRRMITEQDLDVRLEVDGGIRIENVESVLAAGADVVVSGSAVFRGSVTANVKAFLEKLNGKP